MSTYRVSVDEDNGSGLEIIIYIALFTILLPIGVVYLLYKLIKWIYAKRQENKYSHSEDFERAIQDLTSLYDSYREGLINNSEYEDKKPQIVKRIKVNKCSNERIRKRLISLKDLHEKKILLDSEYETIRKDLAEMLS